MIVALAGGVGGSRLAVGLAAVLPPQLLTIVVNTGDDFEHLGFTICPDLDTVMYALAGVNDRTAGWGRADETFRCLEVMAGLGAPSWFGLGDRDLAVHLTRTAALRAGEPLSTVTARLGGRLGVTARILPMSDQPVRTIVQTTEARLAFQE